jgi:hypothetical protein
MAKLYKDAMADFMSAITKAMNDSGVLYRDMIYQDELFLFQDFFIDALVQAYEDKLLSREQMLAFEHIFHNNNEKA